MYTYCDRRAKIVAKVNQILESKIRITVPNLDCAR